MLCFITWKTSTKGWLTSSCERSAKIVGRLIGPAPINLREWYRIHVP